MFCSWLCLREQLDGLNNAVCDGSWKVEVASSTCTGYVDQSSLLYVDSILENFLQLKISAI